MIFNSSYILVEASVGTCETPVQDFTIEDSNNCDKTHLATEEGINSRLCYVVFIVPKMIFALR